VTKGKTSEIPQGDKYQLGSRTRNRKEQEGDDKMLHEEGGKREDIEGLRSNRAIPNRVGSRSI
jgi:hypothetical protein